MRTGPLAVVLLAVVGVAGAGQAVATLRWATGSAALAGVVAYAALLGYVAMTPVTAGARRPMLVLGVALLGIVASAGSWTSLAGGWFLYTAMDVTDMTQHLAERELTRQRWLAAGTLVATMCLGAAVGPPRIRRPWLAAGTLGIGACVSYLVAQHTLAQIGEYRSGLPDADSGAGWPTLWAYLPTWLYLVAAVAAVAVALLAGQLVSGAVPATVGAGLLAVAAFDLAWIAVDLAQPSAASPSGNVAAPVLSQELTSVVAPDVHGAVAVAATLLGVALVAVGCLRSGRHDAAPIATAGATGGAG